MLDALVQRCREGAGSSVCSQNEPRSLALDIPLGLKNDASHLSISGKIAQESQGSFALQFSGTLGAVPSSVSAASQGITSALAGHPLQSFHGLSHSLFLPVEAGPVYCPHSTGEETEAHAVGPSLQLQSCLCTMSFTHHPLPSRLEFCAEPQPQALLSGSSEKGLPSLVPSSHYKDHCLVLGGQHVVPRPLSEGHSALRIPLELFLGQTPQS